MTTASTTTPPAVIDTPVDNLLAGGVSPDTLKNFAAAGLQAIPLTIDAVLHLMRAGYISEGAPIELLGGVLVWKERNAIGEDPMTIGNIHTLLMKRLMTLVPRIDSRIAHMYCQGPIRISEIDCPEPDGVIVAGTPEDYRDRYPSSGEIFCAIEVSHSSLRRDRTIKLAMYAGAGIPQYIIINIPDAQIEVHEQPDTAGHTYASRTVLKRGDTVQLFCGGTVYLNADATTLLP